MEFVFETHYTAKALASMAKTLRKTVRKKHSRFSHIAGWLVVILTLPLLLSGGFVFDFRTAVTGVAVLVILCVLLFEDRINGYIAKKRMLAETEKAVTVFSEDKFISTTDVGKTEWNYDKIILIAETAGFFVFVFSASHAQLYDKQNLQGGTADDFRTFIETATGKKVLSIR